MKLLFDHNLSYLLVRAIADLYPHSEHVRDVGLSMADDELIWTYAQQQGLVIVSKDSDFYYRSMIRGHPPKVVWIRLGNCTTQQIENLLRRYANSLYAFEQDVDESFLIIA